MRNFIRLFMMSIMLTVFATVTAAAAEPVKFKVKIENIASSEGQTASNGDKWPFAISPGMWMVHNKDVKLFTTGKKDSGKGLEAQAEDGNPEMLVKSFEAKKGVMSIGIFNTPLGAKDASPIIPGGAYEFTLTAAPGARLSFAFMFGQSNDLFYSPVEKGMKLFDADDKPMSGDITSKVILWDAGTEINQEPGVGADQGPRQKDPNTGASESKTVRTISDVKDGFTYPNIKDVMRITITPEGTAQSMR